MYRLEFEEKFSQKMDIFLESYRNIFKRLYSDTWIEDEDLLIRTYLENTEAIEKSIYSKIGEILLSDFVWYKILNWKRSIKIFLKSFMLEIFYEEDIQEKIRFIENIEINKK